MSFLDEVLTTKQREIEALRLAPPPALPRPGGAFRAAVAHRGLSVIAEIKRRSPSKGDLGPNLDPALVAHAYASGGAAAISCLTDRDYFGAHDGDLEQACSAGLPVLRKDFIIDELQVDESQALGASAVLLIARLFSRDRLEALISHAGERGLDPLVEAHDEEDLARALEAGAGIVGINNRDLGTLAVDPGAALRLRPRIPNGVLSVAESGVRVRADVERIEEAGFDAVLVGEALVTSPDPRVRLQELRGDLPEAAR